MTCYDGQFCPPPPPPPPPAGEGENSSPNASSIMLASYPSHLANVSEK